MKIFVIGGGGREHAIAWQLAQEGHTICGAPGNPGIASLGHTLSTSDFLAAADRFQPDLTVVGPEVPLVGGVVDRFRAAGRPIVGPTEECARLEASKIHSKDFMLRVGIPTARYERCKSVVAGLEALKRFDLPVVVKADGLAAGKGVIIAQTAEEADAAVHSLGPDLVIEEFLVGEEVSFIVLSDGKNVVPLEACQDHKTVFDNDQGPNTGGMGAYCDGRILTDAQTSHVMDTVIQPAIHATGFTGFLYAGLMMTSAGPKVLEFNVRLGDPETQPLMHRLRGGFGDALMKAATGGLKGTTLDWSPNPSLCVVLASEGYPASPKLGDEIQLPNSTSATIFQAGTKLERGKLVTSGGRVLGVTASGNTLTEAISNTYNEVSKVSFRGMHFRTDIGKKGLTRW